MPRIPDLSSAAVLRRMRMTLPPAPDPAKDAAKPKRAKSVKAKKVAAGASK